MEIEILNLIQNIRNPLLDKLMVFVTRLADANFIWIVLTVVFLLMKKTRKIGIIMLVSMLVDAVLCNLLLKNIVARQRPFMFNETIELLIKRPKDYSFPSGHTAFSFAAVGSVYLTNGKRINIPSFLLAILIAFSRIYLYVHFPSDILGGIIVGLLSAKLAYLLVKHYILN